MWQRVSESPLANKQVLIHVAIDWQVQNAGHRSQVRSQGTGHGSQVTGHRAQVIGHRKRSKNS